MYKAIRMSGGDVVNFLQGQLTQDIARLDSHITLPAAWCSPKGRVVTTLRLIRSGACVDFVLPAANLDAVLPRLTMYRMRADVTMQPLDADWTACAFSDEHNLKVLGQLGLRPENRLNACRDATGVVAVSTGANDCVEVFGATSEIEAAGLDIAASLDEPGWCAARVNAGLADISGVTVEKFTPHMLNLDATGAISFDKGCYTGQEVVARTENLGKSKRRLMRYADASGQAAIGDSLSDGERDVGSTVNVGERHLLAVTPVAQHDQTLLIHGSEAEPAGLPYEY
jgi:folate-binding protein YgfZ